MKIIKYLLFKTTRWLEKNFPIFAKFQDQRRFKKFDDAPSCFGINSHTNPHVYKFLIDRVNSKSLSSFEIEKILSLFQMEIFGKVHKDEFDDWLIAIGRHMRENYNELKQEVILLSKTNNQKYLATMKSCILFEEVVLGLKHNRKENDEDAIRNIKKMFCELRRLLNKHILGPGET